MAYGIAGDRCNAVCDTRWVAQAVDTGRGVQRWVASVSPDGTKIAFSAQRDPDIVSAFSSDIYTVNLADNAVKKIVDTPGPDTRPEWSPDGKEIAYVTANANPNFFYTDKRIAVVGSDGGMPRVLTLNFDEDPCC